MKVAADVRSTHREDDRWARTAGAKADREPFDVPGVGRIAIVQLPGGAMMGWMTPVAA